LTDLVGCGVNPSTALTIPKLHGARRFSCYPPSSTERCLLSFQEILETTKKEVDDRENQSRHLSLRKHDHDRL